MTGAGATLDLQALDAVVFDMDGVVTDTARVHFRAWKRLFDDYLHRRRGEDEPPFTGEDYRTHVDGRRREDGVAAFLAARGLEPPWGGDDDGPDADTVVGLGRRKDGYFHEVLARDGVEVFDSTVALVRSLHDAGVATALITASRNAADVLEAAGLTELFAVRVDGVVAAELGLPGKPDPAVFLEATRRVGAEPDRTAVVEDAVAGVEAGRRGHFAVVLGVDRSGDPGPLRDAGAHAVVADLAEVRLTGR